MDEQEGESVVMGTADLGRGKGAIAAGHSLTAQAAADILRDGGNAFDAALGAMCAATVAEPVLASFGGGGFLLARRNPYPGASCCNPGSDACVVRNLS